MSAMLVVLDPELDAPQPALTKAARLAGDNPVSIFVNVRSKSIEKRLASGMDALEDTRRKISAKWRDHIHGLAEQAGATINDLHIVWSGNTYLELINTIDDGQPEMVVVHTHYEPRLKRLLFTPLEWKLIRKASCPLLFAGNRKWIDRPPVVAAVDPDPFSKIPDPLTRKIVEHGQRMASRLGGDFTVVHALEYPDETLVMVAGEAIPSSVDVAESQRQLYRQRLEAIRETEGLGENQTQLIEGSPAHALADYMEALPPGLLVMGTVQKNSVERLLLGNTAEQILFRSVSDVLVLRNPESRAGTDFHG